MDRSRFGQGGLFAAGAAVAVAAAMAISSADGARAAADHGIYSRDANGPCYSTSASFRVYLTSAASFVDHAVQLSTLSRYAGAFAYSQDPDRFAVEVHRAGYATSPTYAENLIGLMRQYNLYRFDASL